MLTIAKIISDLFSIIASWKCLKVTKNYEFSSRNFANFDPDATSPFLENRGNTFSKFWEDTQQYENFRCFGKSYRLDTKW